MVHVPGQLDFSIEEKEFPVTVFRRKISSIWEFVETPGHVAVITRRGKCSGPEDADKRKVW